MRTTLASIAALAGLALSAPLFAADVATAEGLTFGKQFESSHAVAYASEKGYTMVVFSDKPLAPADLVKDGVVGFFAGGEYREKAKAVTATLMIDGDGNATCFLVEGLPDTGGNSCGLYQEGAFKLESRDANRVSGWVDWHDNDESMKMKFDLPITGREEGT